MQPREGKREVNVDGSTFECFLPSVSSRLLRTRFASHVRSIRGPRAGKCRVRGENVTLEVTSACSGNTRKDLANR